MNVLAYNLFCSQTMGQQSCQPDTAIEPCAIWLLNAAEGASLTDKALGRLDIFDITRQQVLMRLGFQAA